MFYRYLKNAFYKCSKPTASDAFFRHADLIVLRAEVFRAISHEPERMHLKKRLYRVTGMSENEPVFDIPGRGTVVSPMLLKILDA